MGTNKPKNRREKTWESGTLSVRLRVPQGKGEVNGICKYHISEYFRI